MAYDFTYPTVVLALLVAAFVKGATGLGFPLIATPTVALLLDIRTAVTILILPNLFINLVGGQKLLSEAFQRRARHVDPAHMPQPAVFPDHHLAKGAVGIDPDYASHPCLLSIKSEGSGGRHDNYGSALAAQPGKSQGRPDNELRLESIA